MARETWVDHEEGTRIVSGEAEAPAPVVPIEFGAAEMPGLSVQRHVHFDRLLKQAAPLPALKTAVITPGEAEALGGALLAAEHTLIDPILIGDADLYPRSGGRDRQGCLVLSNH